MVGNSYFMDYFFERLSFKKKIIFGFSLLSAIFIFGMGYMLYEFTHISQLSINMIEKQQPIIRNASNAREYTQSAANYIHKFLLNGDESNLTSYFKTVEELNGNLEILLEYAENPEFELNIKELKRACDILEEINEYVIKIKDYSNNYEENHPIIKIAASTLNPLALEYLGLLNFIIKQNTNSKISKKVLIELTNMRHSWTQMLSSLRITLATRQARSFVNVKAYADVNYVQMNRLKKLNLDLGFEGLDELEIIRNEYIKHLESTIEQFNKEIWRMDANLMTSKVMPLFDELDTYLVNLSRIQLKQEKKSDRDLSQHLSVAHYSYVVLIIVSFIFSFLIVMFITRSLRRPLIKLVDASDKVAKGNYDTKIIVTGNDEISDLSRSFNDMVRKIQESQLALTTARDIAEHANQVKSEFLTRMSHELRTPLNAILGFAQILEVESSGDNKYVKNILKSGWHLLDLVEELLDLSRIETNTILIKSEKKDILPIIHECVAISRSPEDENSIQIIEDINDNVACYANIDPVRFKQVILNLLSNAIKFNSEKGRVIVKCDFIEKQFIKISICDEGEGLTKTQELEVFDAFQRLDANEKSIEGIGIGLNIAKNLVELMGGNIGVESKVGIGSCFWIELPIIEVVDKSVNSGFEIDKNIEDSTNHAHYKVLYIEDDEFNLELVREILSVMRPEIKLFEAVTAEIGLDIIKKETLDLILMDLNLPGMSGQEALRVLKGNEETQDIPVVALSADAVTASINLGLKNGFEKYITKPINVDDFIDVLDSILDTSKME